MPIFCEKGLSKRVRILIIITNVFYRWPLAHRYEFLSMREAELWSVASPLIFLLPNHFIFKHCSSSRTYQKSVPQNTARSERNIFRIDILIRRKLAGVGAKNSLGDILIITKKLSLSLNLGQSYWITSTGYFVVVTLITEDHFTFAPNVVRSSMYRIAVTQNYAVPAVLCIPSSELKQCSLS